MQYLQYKQEQTTSILGYDTIADDAVIGGTFVDYMTTGGRRIKDAWTQARA